HGQRRRSTLVTTGSLGTHRWCVDAEECAQPQEGAPDPKQAAPCKSPEPGLASTCASRGGCCIKPSARTRSPPAVTDVEGTGGLEAEQSARRPTDDLRIFRSHP